MRGEGVRGEGVRGGGWWGEVEGEVLGASPQGIVVFQALSCLILLNRETYFSMPPEPFSS